MFILFIFEIWIVDGNRPKIQHESLVQSFLNETNVDIIDQIPESSQLVEKDPYADDEDQ